MDCIKIKNLEVFGNHGVYKEENSLGQKFIVCADLFVDIRPSGLSDDIELGVNYAEVCRFINDFMQDKTFKLIEAAAEELAKRTLLKFDRINKIRLEIKKPWAPIGLHLDEVSVVIERGWHDAYIALGSNVGDLKDNINEGLKRINADDDMVVREVSSLMMTKAYGNTEQPDFLNGAAHIRTLYTPCELLQCLKEIESLSGRERKIHWGPRTLDLDILLYDDLVFDSKDLTIPHYDMQNRDFVLKPLNEIAPWLRHPVLNMSAAQMLEKLEANPS